MAAHRISTLPRQCSINLTLLIVSLAITGVFCVLSAVAWTRWGNRLAFFEAVLFALSGMGLGLYATLPGKKKPVARKLILFFGGTAGLVFSIVSRVSLDLEGFFLLLLCGMIGAAVVHHLITVIVGPIFFGRIWCGWGCWTAMILDLLPFRRSPGRVHGRWKSYSLVTFAIVVAIVIVARLGFGYRGISARDNFAHPSELYWILTFNILYYLTGIYLAFALKDNRAFCKYLCPTTVLLKATSRFSLIRIAAGKNHCSECGACAEVCPMDILIPEYIKLGQRVVSTECIMCRTCISICPSKALGFSFDFDPGKREMLSARETGTAETSLKARIS